MRSAVPCWAKPPARDAGRPLAGGPRDAEGPGPAARTGQRQAACLLIGLGHHRDGWSLLPGPLPHAE